MIDRTILKDLKLWMLRKDRKPLVLRGARQVGKTTLINMFARKFDQYIYLNLETKRNRLLFEQELDIDELVSAILLTQGKIRNSQHTTLIFIDEIQNSSAAVAMLRYFYEEANDLYVIAAGSLLETMIGEHVSFPVGRVEYLFIYPLTFVEFLCATGEHELVNLLDKQPVPKFAHERLLKLFHQYALLGGMPEVVARYIEAKDIVTLDSVYKNLLIAYLDDVEKYARNSSMISVIRHTIERSPFEAGRRIKFHGFGSSNYGSKEIKETLLALEKAMLIQLCYPTTSTELPIIPNYKKSPKLQFLDTGLINYFAGLQKYYFSLDDLSAVYQGRIAEHIVGQEFIAAQLTMMNKLNFWVREKKQSSAEVDFVMPHERYLIPVEVKSGKLGKLKSLHQFIEHSDHSYAVRLYAGFIHIDDAITPNGKQFKLVNLPYYLAGQLDKYLCLLFSEHAGRD